MCVVLEPLHEAIEGVEAREERPVQEIEPLHWAAETGQFWGGGSRPVEKIHKGRKQTSDPSAGPAEVSPVLKPHAKANTR